MCDDNTDNDDDDGVAIVCGVEGEGKCDGRFLEEVVEIVLEDVPAVGPVPVFKEFPLFARRKDEGKIGPDKGGVTMAGINASVGVGG